MSAPQLSATGKEPTASPAAAPGSWRVAARRVLRVLRRAYGIGSTLAHRLVLNRLVDRLRAGRPARRLEIGPGPVRLDGFETLSVLPARHVDYVHDAARPLPFRAATFDLIYASHVLEHIPWYRLDTVLRDWVGTLKPGGRLEVWVPDGLRIAETFVAAETGGANEIGRDGWYRFNPERDACVWANGRVFSYGDGEGTAGDPNWHLALFSPRFLEKLLRDAGLVDVERLDRTAVRGHDHGWINLGYGARRP